MIVRDKKQRAIETVTEILKGNWPLAEAIVRKLSDDGLMAQAERDRICAMLRKGAQFNFLEMKDGRALTIHGELLIALADLIETGASK